MTSPRPPELVLGTRGSALAVAQSTLVAQAITHTTGLPVRLQIISTRGDQITDRPLAAIGGKGLFTAELEAALRDGEIDLAVHSLKDLPTEDPEGLVLAAIPPRADPRDVIVGAPLEALPVGAVVGTGSLRRQSQLRALRPDLRLRDIRGNVDTRLRKRDEGEYDAVILAAAGLERLGIRRPDLYPLSPEVLIPAAGQGALAVQIAAHRAELKDRLLAIHDPPTHQRILAERTFLATFGGGCHVAAACYARWEGAGVLHVRAMAQPDPDAPVRRAEARGADPEALGRQLAALLRA